MRRISILDMPDQQFSTILNGRRVTLRIRYNVMTDRYSFDLALDDAFVLHGRKIVTGADLLAPYSFGIGMLFAVTLRSGAEPNRDGFLSDGVGLFQS